MMSLLANTFDSGWFQVALIAHISCAVVGFGGLYGLRWRNSGGNGGGTGGGNSEISANQISNRSLFLLELAVYGVPIFGAAAVGFDDRWDFSQIWITLGFLFYIAWVGIWHIALRPRRPVTGVSAGTGPTENSLGPSPRVKALAYAVSDLLLVAAIYAMVVKPGGLG